MAQETKVEETLCSLQTFERNRYFYGKPMTVSDFEAEQRYLIGKHRYINRLIHGAGVLCGLQVTLPESFAAERPRVELAEGAALDCCGNLIVVSRSGTAEIKGDFDPKGPNYLYIKYTECSKQPVMLAANGSSCEEVCCYNRIQETFEVVASRTAPGGAAAQASAGAAAPALKATAGETFTDAEAACRGLTEKYYQEHLRTCPGCDDPLVFLAVLDPAKGEIDEAETAKYRSVVFNNSMLHELLCGHVSDYANPHRTSAEQVRALQSVNGVGNVGARPFVANIDLRSSDNTIGVTPDVNGAKINLILGANAVRRSHLNEDVINDLLKSSKTVTVTPDAAGKRITLSTTPAKTVTSVGGAKAPGELSSFAREDHAHDLAEGVVERRHLNADVYANLVQGGGIVKVEPDAAGKTIKISADTAPADDLKSVTSVVGAKSVGKSKRFAREDHAHDLHLNGRSPNEKGEFLLTPGANVTIDKGAGDNELVISAEGGSPTVIATGVFVFEGVLPQQVRTSDLMEHGLESGLVAVVLAEEDVDILQTAEAIKAAPVNPTARFGDFTAFDDEAPFLMASVDYARRTVQISLKDRREGSQLDTTVMLTDEPGKLSDESSFRFAPARAFIPSGEVDPTDVKEPSGIVPREIFPNPDGRTYKVRWWAIPARA